MTIYDPSETGRSLGAIGDSIHEIGCFCGYEEQNAAAVHKIGPFLGREGQKDSSGQKLWHFYGHGGDKQKKRHPRKDVSVKSDNRSKNYGKALQRRVIRVSETFEESRSSGDARSERRE